VQHESLKRSADELFWLGKVSTSLVDVTDPEGVQRAALHTEETLGSTNILATSAGVASAGIAGPNAKSWDYSAEAWQDQCQFEWNLLPLPDYPAANVEAWLRTNRHDCINRRKRR
jgi:NAD(P)-dependent dehydrogenase (short-subunit alcohol dehydrogenase family)